VARLITGVFGGVIGSISMAIVTDLFPIERRGRVMGFMQMGFGGSQVLGIPISLYLANKWDWQSPFWLVAGIAIIVAILILIRLQPVRGHLQVQHENNPVVHLFNTILKRDYLVGFTATALLSIGGFMMMPFGSAFAINNLLVKPEQLPILFLAAGITSFVAMPLIGKLSDKIDKYKVFVFATLFVSVMVISYTNLGPQPFWVVIIFNIVLMTGIFGRMIPAGALTSAIPEMRDRGAFMSINSSLQQIAGGIGAVVAGKIVVQSTSTSPLQHYNTLGIVVVSISLLVAALMFRVDKMIKSRKQRQPAPPVGAPPDILEEEFAPQ
jgi:predicted MFS family arabinose efflux permease